MADIANNQKNTVGIENITSGNDLVVNSDGSIITRLNDGAGSSVVKGQTTMAGSLPVVLASNQTSIPVTTEGLKQTYAAAVSGFVPPAAATDIFTITGSATKTIRITLLRVSCTTSAGSGISINAALIKRSTADSAGTSTTMTNVPHDSTNSAATAVVKAYTANPTLGTTVGNVRTSRFQINSAGTTSNELAYELGTRPAQTLVLRGTSEQLCVNFGGATITSPICSIAIEWTEE
jgi:hypothetical protein